MLILKRVLLSSFLLLFSCASNSKIGKAQILDPSERTEIYRAVLKPVPFNAEEKGVCGEAVFTIKGDSLRIAVNAIGLTPGEHMVSLNTFTDSISVAKCPDFSTDKNNDSIIDIIEARDVIGNQITLIRNNLLDTIAGIYKNPVADENGNMSFQIALLWKDFVDALKKNQSVADFDPSKVVVVVHGVSVYYPIPHTVQIENDFGLNKEIPVLSGNMKKM